jgi:glycosyltransferase involved in cell wall biosynthesis
MLSCVLHECAACGRPAIGTMCGGPQDIITDRSGVLVPVDDVETMAKAMLTMLDTASTYDRQAIREDIVARFGRDRVCDLLIEACQDAARAAQELDT